MRISIVVVLALAAPAAAQNKPINMNSQADPGDGTCDDTECTLHEAIELANDTPGLDDIEIGGGMRIEPTVALPAITDAVTIHGETGEYPVIDGKNVSDTVGLELAPNAGSSVIRGLSIVGFDVGIRIRSSNHGIYNCHIGVESNGMTANGNRVGIFSDGDYTSIGSKDGYQMIVSGNDETGIFITLAAHGEIFDTYVGVGADGVTKVPNGEYGVKLNVVDDWHVGADGFPNVISGNAMSGVFVVGGANNTIEGNVVGLSADGSTAVGNGAVGVFIWSSDGNRVKHNVVSANTGAGVGVTTAKSTIIQGNLIGTNAAGLLARPNAYGIYLSEADDTTIGSSSAAFGNVISGNSSTGIFVVLGTGNWIAGNIIGLAKNQMSAVGNQIGIMLDRAAGTTIGDVKANVISGNGQAMAVNSATSIDILANLFGVNESGAVFQNGNGIFVFGKANHVDIQENVMNVPQTAIEVKEEATGVTMRANRISGGFTLGMDLWPPSRTANDPGDADTGPNGLQNYPILQSAVSIGNQTAFIKGTLDSTASQSFILEVATENGDGECVNTPQPSGPEFQSLLIVDTDSEGKGEFGTSLPLSAGARVTATATDSDGSTSEPAPCIVVEECPSVSIDPDSLPAAMLDQPYEQIVTATGFTRAFSFSSSGSLPPGLKLTSKGVLTGTPTQEGSFTFMVKATDEAGCPAGRSYTLVVGSCSAITLPANALEDGTRGVAYSDTITASGGTGTMSYAISKGAPPAGLTMTTGGVLHGTPTTPGSATFSVTATDEKGCTGGREYQIDVACSAVTVLPATLPAGSIGTVYGVTLTSDGATGATSFAVTSGSLPSGLSLASGGLLSGTPDAAGSRTFTVTATDGQKCAGSKSYTLSVSCPAIDITPDELANPAAGAGYQATLAASGGTAPYVFDVFMGPLPAGLSLSSAGVLSGTAAAAGAATFVVRATDAEGCEASQSYTVTTTCAELDVRPTTLPPASTLGPYLQTLSARGGAGAVSFELAGGTLAPGLTLSSAGVLAGNPSMAGSFAFTVRARDANLCTGTRAYTLPVTACPTISVSPDSLPDGALGDAYAATITAGGGRAPMLFSVGSGALPGGLTLLAGGSLGGTPLAAGSFTFTVFATDADGCQGTREYDIVVPPAPSGTPDAGAPPDAAAADAATSPDAADAVVAMKESAEGCSCRVGGRPPGPSPALLLVALAFVVHRRRRSSSTRQARGSSPPPAS